MKKYFLTFSIISSILIAAGCSKDNGDGPVCTKVEFSIEWNNLSEDILKNIDIAISGKDFQGKEFSFPITAEGKKVFAIDNVEIKDIEDHCPFTYCGTVTPKETFEEKDSYEAIYDFLVKAVFYDSKGNKLPCESELEGGLADEIIFATSSRTIKSETKPAKEIFLRNVQSAFRESETTFVFFRNSKSKKFSHSTPSSN